eukprot:1807116-Pyramimonas_sp.AAC.1
MQSVHRGSWALLDVLGACRVVPRENQTRPVVPPPDLPRHAQKAQGYSVALRSRLGALSVTSGA